MNVFSKVLVVAICVCSSGFALAAKKLDPALQASSKAKFDDQSAAILVQMKPGGHWQYVTQDERNTIERRLAEISALLDSVESADALPADRKGKLLTAQEDVNAILTNKDGRRLICQNVAPTGSHRMMQQCETFASREEQRRETHQYLRDRKQHVERQR